MTSALHVKGYHCIVRNNDRTDIQGMRCNSRHHKHTSTRYDNRTAVRQGISRRTCWCRDNQSVGLIRCEILAIDTGTDRYHSGSIPFQDSHVIQRIRALVQGLSVGLDLNHGTTLHGIVIIMQGLQTRLDIIRRDISQEPQASHIDTQDRNMFGPYPARRLQERTVATHRNGEVSLEIITYEGGETVFFCIQDTMHITHLIDEVIVFLINDDTCTMHFQTSQHLLYGSRFLTLIEVAKESKCKGLR